LDTDQIFGESEETKRETDVDAVMNKYINPYATRLPANWQKVYLTTFFEIDCHMRQVMIRAMRKAIKKRLKGKTPYDSDSDGDSDVEEFTNDISSHFHNKGKEQAQTKKCCSHDHGNHSHNSSHQHGNQFLGSNPGMGGHHPSKSQNGSTSTSLGNREADQSMAHLDNSMDI
jgi:hypothetical protein